MLLQSPLGVPRTQRAGAQRVVQAPTATALACRSRPSAAPGGAQLARFAGPALRLRPRQRPRGVRGLPVASAAEGSSANGTVVPAGGSAAAVAITGIAVFSAAPYVHDFLKGACAAAPRSRTKALKPRACHTSAAARCIWRAEGEVHRRQAERADGAAGARGKRRVRLRQRLVRCRSVRRACAAGREAHCHALRWLRPRGRRGCCTARHHRRARAVVLAARGAQLRSCVAALAHALTAPVCASRLRSTRWRCCSV